MGVRRRDVYKPMKKIGNGRWLNIDGYVLVWVKRGEFEFEHRLVAQRAIGRKLKKGEVVHHVYGDKLDNKNLLICTQEYHDALHRRQKKLYKQWHLPKPGTETAKVSDTVTETTGSGGWDAEILARLRKHSAPERNGNGVQD